MNRTQSAIRTMWGWAAKRDYFTRIACQTTYAIGCIEQPRATVPPTNPLAPLIKIFML